MESSIFYANVYINNISTSNSIPEESDSSFNNTFNFPAGKLILSWGNGSDTETPTLGLYYNLRVGLTPGGHEVVSGVYGGSSNPTAGYFGNMMQRKSITLNRPDLENETIYWAVQTIDTGLAKSAWSTEQVFEITQSCTEDWSYGDWSSCVGGQQTRTATDLNSCGTEVNKSTTTQSCSTGPSGPSGPSGPIIPPEEENETTGNETGGVELGEDNETIGDKNESAIQQICVPFDLKCEVNNLLECIEDGVEWVLKEVCEYGCEDGKCKEEPLGIELIYLWPVAVVVLIVVVAIIFLILKPRV